MEDPTTMKLLQKLGSSGHISTPGSSNGDEGGFEGPEKILEVDFNPSDAGSMRTLERKVWDSILDLARCQILSKTSNDCFDAYVLSESSLFVYDNKVFIKTCGTTTLLRCLPLLLKEAKRIGKEMQWLCYSRKNYIFPEVQEFPHNCFAHEIEYTKKCQGPHGEPLKGGAYILGDIQGDHWYVFCADYSGSQKDVVHDERNLNIMMYGLDPDVCKQFYRHNDLSSADDAARATKNTGIVDLCAPGTIIDDCMFEPCGYSMNGLDGENFYTVHITPEVAFSYASFETNLPLSDYSTLLEKVLKVFRPERFVITLFADEQALTRIEQCPTEVQSLSLDRVHVNTFRRETQSTTCFRDEYACRMAVYQSDKFCPVAEEDDLRKSPTLSVGSSDPSTETDSD